MTSLNDSSRTPAEASSSSFGRLWLAREIGALGYWTLFVGLLVHSYTLSDSSTTIGTVVAAQLLLPFLLGPLLRRVMGPGNGAAVGVGAQLMRAVTLVPLLFLEPISGLTTVLQVALFSSVPVPFAHAAESALLRAGPARPAASDRFLVYSRLVVLAASPALAGAVYAAYNIRGVAAVSILAAVVAAFLLILVKERGDAPASEPALSEPGDAFALPVGLLTALRDPQLQIVAAVQWTGAFILGGLVVAEADYTVQRLITGIENAAILLSVQAIGAFVGVAALARLGRRYAPSEVVSAGLMIAALGQLGLSISTSVPAASALAGVVGFGVSLAAIALADLGRALLAERSLHSGGPGTAVAAAALFMLSVVVTSGLCAALGSRFTLAISGILLSVLTLWAFGAVPQLQDRKPAA